jgi:general L-amino acid transport system permease protein
MYAAPLIRHIVNDARLRGLAYQAVAVAAVLAVAVLGFDHVTRTLHQQNIASGFAFLSRQAGFGLSQTFLEYKPADSYARALAAGVVNTTVVSTVGIVLATLFGFVTGLAQLSTNRLLALIARLYVNIQRGIPLLLWLFFWYGAIVTTLPTGREAWEIIPHVFLTNAGLSIPSLLWTSGHVIVPASVVCGLLLAVVVARRARTLLVNTCLGKLSWLLVPLALLGPPLIAIVAFGPGFALSLPEPGRFRVTGGMRLTAEFTALLVALSLSASAGIAEIVRAGVQSVDAGQWEASTSLGLHRVQVLRLVVLPQALRTIVPPLTGAYLSLLKSSSLAIAVGYPDLLMVANTTINQTGQAIECTAIYMLVYLALSVVTASFMNWYNARIARGERS